MKKNIMLCLIIGSLWISTVIHQYQDFQKHHALNIQQKKILQNYNELQNLLREQIDTDKDQEKLIQKIYDNIQERR